MWFGAIAVTCYYQQTNKFSTFLFQSTSGSGNSSQALVVYSYFSPINHFFQAIQCAREFIYAMIVPEGVVVSIYLFFPRSFFVDRRSSIVFRRVY